jgi:uncharacterized protein YndB with AHSA1/START domain
MSEIVYSRTFACRPADLWPWLTESDKLKQWLHGTESHRYLTDGPVVRGTKFEMGIKEGGRVSQYAGEVLACEPRRLLRIVMRGGCGPKPMEMEVEYRLTDEGRATRVDYACRMKMPPGFLWKLMGWIGRGAARLMLKKFFATLASKVEATA